MRATQRRTASRHTGLLYAVLGLTGVTGFAACTDALHLDPPASTTGSSGSGSGGGAPGSCRSSPDCSSPTPVCDTIAQKCVMCLTELDCSPVPGPICSQGKCKCLDTSLAYCPGESPACVDTMASPVNCGTCGTPCPTGCIDGTCNSGTSSSSGAGGGSADDGGSDASGD